MNIFPRIPKYINQSCMCGKGVGLGLFHSDSLESQSYDFDALAVKAP